MTNIIGRCQWTAENSGVKGNEEEQIPNVFWMPVGILKTYMKNEETSQ